LAGTPLEYVFNGFPGALEYFAGAFHSADSDVLACLCRAYAQIRGCIDGMKRHQVGGGFSCSSSCAADAFGGALADISRATPHVMFGAGVDAGILPWGGGSWLFVARSLCRRRRLRHGNPGEEDRDGEQSYIHLTYKDEWRLGMFQNLRECWWPKTSRARLSTI
jgi:hypothetical protein